jgi:hypothetical protein
VGSASQSLSLQSKATGTVTFEKKSFLYPFREGQGDQIGRIVAHWVIF